jgi:hypothetical protein
MINTRFEAYKLKRELKRSGIDYEFQRLGANDFGEPDDEPTVVGSLKGLYHEQNSNIEITTGDTTRVRTKKIPMILCLFDDTTSLGSDNEPALDEKELGLKVDDQVVINGKTFKVTGIVNIQEWSIIGDISLEVIDDGLHD